MTEMDNSNHYSILVDHDGRIVIHTSRPDLEGKNIYKDFDSSLFEKYFEQVKEAEDIVRMAYEFEGNPVIGIFQKVDGRNWYLSVASIDDSHLLSVYLKHERILWANGVMLLIILILMVMIIKIRAELHSMNKLLTRENEKDFLTGIYNRRYLNLYLESLWNQKKVNQVSLFILDVDFFKKYNDHYGHLLGDEVLKRLTGCINESVRKSDVLARFGGEEFALVLEGVEVSETKRIAEQIIDAVYQLGIEHETSPFKRVTISIGVVIVQPNQLLSVREAVDYADEALYEAKKSGRNKVVLDDRVHKG
ncbi:diguanylate cyclase (GGDEF) domain-containing protein [Tindallia magadiensis]|uniref:Diguanylate cyclase (GGDEF) domain-containing protein n=1 Tax=Tindallia magadiensis TaxID=69895 RepID=A0A1I3GE38_9FIRM|nr:diguanylate cyclase [Tindallia magadiensis]SFI21729.1 diguanylate cyclase (GGDEF) domain-containing protein [Tindallia magadiensis]